MGWFIARSPERKDDATPARRDEANWLEIANCVIANRSGLEFLKEGAADAMVTAALRAQEEGRPLAQIIDAIEDAYHAHAIYTTPDEYPCDEWQPRAILKTAA